MAPCVDCFAERAWVRQLTDDSSESAPDGDSHLFVGKVKTDGDFSGSLGV